MFYIVSCCRAFTPPTSQTSVKTTLPQHVLPRPRPAPKPRRRVSKNVTEKAEDNEEKNNNLSIVNEQSLSSSTSCDVRISMVGVKPAPSKRLSLIKLSTQPLLTETPIVSDTPKHFKTFSDEMIFKNVSEKKTPYRSENIIDTGGSCSSVQMKENKFPKLVVCVEAGTSIFTILILL